VGCETNCLMYRLKNLDPAQELDKGKSNYLPDPPLSPTENRQPTSHVTERPLISALLEQIKDAPFYEDQLVPDGRRTWPERNPRFGLFAVLFTTEISFT
jgi:hypothetical protein